MKLEPDFNGAQLTLASIALHEQDYGQAECCLRKALSIKENRAAGFTMPGVALRNLGVLLRDKEPEEAPALFIKVLELDPGSASAHRELGWIYRKLDRIGEAEVHVRKAIDCSRKTRGRICILAISSGGRVRRSRHRRSLVGHMKQCRTGLGRFGRRLISTKIRMIGRKPRTCKSVRSILSQTTRWLI